MFFFILRPTSIDAIPQEQKCKEDTNVVTSSCYIEMILTLLIESITIEVGLSEYRSGKQAFRVEQSSLLEGSLASIQILKSS